MKEKIKNRIAAVALALVMITSLSATAFADGPQGGPQQGGFQQDRQMGGPQQGGFQQDRQMGGPQQGSFGQDRQTGDPQLGGFQQNRQMGDPQQGGFGQDRQMGDSQQGGFGQDRQPPEMPEGDEERTAPSDGENRQRGPMNSQQPPERNNPMDPGGMDPMNQILSAVNELEDEDVRANIEALMQTHLDALEAERNAEDDDARAKAAEAVAATQAALNEALSAAGIDIGMEAPDGQQPPEKPEGGQFPAAGRQSPEKTDEAEDMTPPEKPEGENPSLPQNEQDMFRLFQQFLEWLKGNIAA